MLTEIAEIVDTHVTVVAKSKITGKYLRFGRDTFMGRPIEWTTDIASAETFGSKEYLANRLPSMADELEPVRLKITFSILEDE